MTVDEKITEATQSILKSNLQTPEFLENLLSVFNEIELEKQVQLDYLNAIID